MELFMLLLDEILFGLEHPLLAKLKKDQVQMVYLLYISKCWATEQDSHIQAMLHSQGLVNKP